jgi:hypothetical protein
LIFDNDFKSAGRVNELYTNRFGFVPFVAVNHGISHSLAHGHIHSERDFVAGPNPVQKICSGRGRGIYRFNPTGQCQFSWFNGHEGVAFPEGVAT